MVRWAGEGIRHIGLLDSPFRPAVPWLSCLYANVAQLVEQFTRNEQVTGSSPVIGSRNAPLRPKTAIRGVFPWNFPSASGLQQQTDAVYPR